MLTEIYIEALLVDEELADQVWEVWRRGEVSDLAACSVWLWMAYNGDKEQKEKPQRRLLHHCELPYRFSIGS